MRHYCHRLALSMKLDLKTNLTILNIFKDDFEYIRDFVEEHCILAKSVVMLNTGNKTSFEYAQSLTAEYGNLKVFYKEYEYVNFSKFRNDCLSLFDRDTDYYCWVDTDELLKSEKNEIDISADILDIERIDGSLKFKTYLKRMFRTTLDGEWQKPIHEHFSPIGECVADVCSELTLHHLSSEAVRSPKKRQIYFDILQSELDEAVKVNNRQGMIDSLQHLILMSSHDFRKPELCISYFNRFKDLIYGMNTSYEISKVQKLNILLHSIISFSRLHITVDDELISQVLKIDSSKSTMFQLLRGMVFNPANIEKIKEIYETTYRNLDDKIINEFNNLDFTSAKEISWFENKLYNKA